MKNSSISPQKWLHRGITREVFSERRSVQSVVVVHMGRTDRGAPFTVHVSLPLLTLLPVTVEMKTSTMGDILISQEINGFDLIFKLFIVKNLSPQVRVVFYVMDKYTVFLKILKI